MVPPFTIQCTQNLEKKIKKINKSSFKIEYLSYVKTFTIPLRKKSLIRNIFLSSYQKNQAQLDTEQMSLTLRDEARTKGNFKIPNYESSRN